MPDDDRLDELLRGALGDAASPVPSADAVDEARRGVRRRGTQRRRFRLAGIGLATLAVLAVVAGVLVRESPTEDVQTVAETTTTTATVAVDDGQVDDVGNGLSFDLPEGWALAPGPLTLTNDQVQGVSQADPAEILSFGTGPLYFGWDLQCHPPNVPLDTLEAMGPDEVLVQVLEQRLRGTADLPSRPEHFDETTVPEWVTDCADPPATLRRLWFRADGGGDPALEREIGVLVAIGDAADGATVAELWDTLDGLEIEPLPNTRRALELEVPTDMGYFGSVLRLDQALDNIPFDAYPWVQVDTWEGGEPQGGDRTLVLVVARAADGWLDRSITPELAAEIASNPEGVAHDSDDTGMISWSADRDEPLRWRWWAPEEGTIAFLAGTGISQAELDAAAASADWTERTIDPRLLGWRAPHPVGCPDPAELPVNSLRPVIQSPRATSTVLEQGLWTLGSVGAQMQMRDALTGELVERDGDVWQWRDDNGNANFEHGEPEALEEHGVQLQVVQPTSGSTRGVPSNYVENLPATTATCWPSP